MSEKTAYENIKKNVPENLALTEDDRNRLEEEVRSLLKEDVTALSQIRKLLKTDDTFSNSSGNLYLYLKDNRICRECTGHLRECPKKRAGYQFHLVYDRQRDEIKTLLQECPYQHEKMSILERISPCDAPREKIYREATSFVSFIKSVDSQSKVPDCVKTLVYANRLLKNIHSDLPQRGYVLRSINDKNLSQNLLMTISYLSSKAENRTAYISLPDLFSLVSSLSFESRQTALDDITSCERVPVLFIEGLNLFPKRSDKKTKDLFFELLKSRNEKGKLTFACMDTTLGIDRLFKSYFREEDYLPEALKLAEDLFELQVIRDFDVR